MGFARESMRGLSLLAAMCGGCTSDILVGAVGAGDADGPRAVGDSDHGGDLAALPDNDVVTPGDLDSPAALLPQGTLVAAGTCSCRLDDQGAIHCWGYCFANSNFHPPLGTWRTLAMSPWVLCATTALGVVHCFEGLDDPGNGVPTVLASVAVSRGGRFNGCGIAAGGGLSCWGTSPIAAPLPAGSFVQVSVGNGFACALTTEGEVRCFGETVLGPITPPSGNDFVAVTCGAQHACVLARDGRVTCFGDDIVDYWPPVGAFVRIEAGVRATCGIRQGGSVTCWGSGAVSPDPDGTFTDLAVGEDHVCGRTKAGTVHCWGSDAHGQCSQG